MEIFRKVKAFFRYQKDQVEMDLTAAEIKEGVVYLHPRDEEKVTYRIETDDIAIILNKGLSISPRNIFRLGPRVRTTKRTTTGEDKKRSTNPEEKRAKKGLEGSAGEVISPDEFDRFKKRKFVVSLYPEEYETVMTSIKSYGYKRADFVMACVNSASKGTMEKAHKKVVKSHKETIKAQKALEAQRQSAISS